MSSQNVEGQRWERAMKQSLWCYCVQYQDGQKRRKPNYSSVDLSEVEWEDKDDFVRWTRQCWRLICLIVRVDKDVQHLKQPYICRLSNCSSSWLSIHDSAPTSLPLLCFLLQLRNAMVNRRTGTFSMEVKKTVDRGVKELGICLTRPCCSPEAQLNLLLAPLCFQRRVLKMHNDYYFTDIKGTPFRWSQTSPPR